MSGNELKKLRAWMKANSFDETPVGSIEKLFIGGYMEKARGSYFVEAGAVNGFHLSQTATLENVHGWDGLLIEGHAGLFELLDEGERQVSKRHAVLGPGDLGIFESKSKGMLGQSQLRDDLINDDCHRIQTRTLEEVLTEAGAPGVIDFLVLDVEEALPQVWSGLDFHRRHFDFIAMEMKEEYPEIMEDLKDRGYRLAGILGGEDYIFTK